MRRLLCSLLMVCALAASAAGPDDQYIYIYNLIQHGDALSQSGQNRGALDKYLEAQKELLKIQSVYPNWNDRVVKFRLNYLAERLQALSKVVGASQSVPATQQQTPTVNDDLQKQIDRLTEQLKAVEADRASLDAKLKEALSVKPQAANVEDLQRAETQIQSLLKERDLLQVALQQEKNKKPASVTSTSKTVAPAPRRNESSEIKKILEAENKKLRAVEKERDDFRKRLKTAEENLEDAQKEIASLKRTVSARETRATRANSEKKLQSRITQLEARLQVLEAKPTPLSEEEKALFKTPPARLAETPATPTSQANLSATTTGRTPETAPAPKRVPEGAGPLLAEAERAFAARRFDEAEKKYLEVLNQDKNNVYMLANLAAIQLEMNRVDEAEKNLQTAIANDPNDAFSLNLYGMLKFRQNKLDEALDYLSRSAKLNPDNAETQNYLGVTLSQKGQQTAAEAALRKALQIQPGYASAHHNLAIVYATQNPPFIQLARHHYEKVVSLGHEKNADLEKMLNYKK